MSAHDQWNAQCGGTLLIPPHNILMDLNGLIKWLGASKATCAFVPTAIGERLLSLTWPDGIALKTLLTGGDSLHHRPPAGLPFRFVNTYGPTENTVDSLWAEIGPAGARPVIGKPISGVTATVVDDNHDPVSPGDIGELVLGGAQVAKGYRNRPELTAQRFTTSLEGRSYHTGDLVRVNDDGDFEFHGRIDDQVQLLGVRVEPGEVEALLKTDNRIADAVCLGVRSGRETIGLIAHVSTKEAVTDVKHFESELRQRLATQLPPTIVPKQIRLHASLPYTTSGKIDRKQLDNDIAIDRAKPLDLDIEDDPLLSIWRKALKGRGDELYSETFWDLGGDSLAAIELLLGIERLAGVQIPVGVFLEDPTLLGLRRAITEQRTPTIIRLAQGAEPPLVLWYTGSGDLESYQTLLPLLKGREVIGVMSPALSDPTYAPSSLEAAVRFGLDALKTAGFDEAAAHLGYSFAGLLAFEAARQVEQQGMPAPLVVLIGALPPLKPYGAWINIANYTRWFISRVSNILWNSRYRKSLTFGKFAKNRHWQHDNEIFSKHFALGRLYKSHNSPGAKILYFREKISPQHSRERPAFNRPDRGWSEWVSINPDVCEIMSDHIGLLKGKAVEQIAKIVNERLVRSDS